MCGQCIHACPVGAIHEHEQIDEFLAAVADPDKIVVTQIAPAVRVAIGEEVGMATGEMPMDKFVAGLRRIGIDYVLRHQLHRRPDHHRGGQRAAEARQGGRHAADVHLLQPRLDQIHARHFYPDLLPNLSTCKSPQQMFGALAKTYYAEKADIDPTDIFSVSIMPCTAKKFESRAPGDERQRLPRRRRGAHHQGAGRMIRQSGIDFAKLPRAAASTP